MSIIPQTQIRMTRYPRTRTESQLHLHPFAVIFLAGLALVMSMADSPFTLPVQAQQDFNKVQIKATRVTDHVYMLEGSGGNIGVSIGAEGIVIVDDQFAPLAQKIKQALKNIADQPVRFVLNTHFHGDHSGGNPE